MNYNEFYNKIKDNEYNILTFFELIKNDENSSF